MQTGLFGRVSVEKSPINLALEPADFEKPMAIQHIESENFWM